MIESLAVATQHLHRTLADSFQQTPPGLLEFFSPYDHQATAHWEKVCAEVDTTLGLGRPIHDDALLSALLTFDLLHAYLTALHRSRG